MKLLEESGAIPSALVGSADISRLSARVEGDKAVGR